MSKSVSKESDVQAILISFYVGGRRKLFIMLGADGSINRSGGRGFLAEGVTGDLFIGMTDGKAFQALSAQVDPEWFKSDGRSFEFPDRRDLPVVLRLILKTSVGENLLQFSYGLEPADIGNFVREAVKLTEPWYQEQRQIVQERSRPWWKFW